MKLRLVLWLTCLWITLHSVLTWRDRSSGEERQKRFLSLFNIIQFPNEICNSTQSQGSTGVCYTAQECLQFGGRQGGDCAAGFGVCCLFEYTCKNTRSQPNEVIYFQNEGYPQSSDNPDICLFSMAIKDDSICQIRLDFIDFNLDAGSMYRNPCDRDNIEVLTSGVSPVRVGKLCGENTGQHMYIPIMNEQAQPMIRVMTSPRGGNLTRPYTYNIKATQIDCTSATPAMRELRAPDGCLQYYTARQGTITSFNWSPGANTIYSPNQDYTICFRRQFGDCQLTLQRSQGIPAYSTFIGQKTEPFTTCGPDNGCGKTDCLVKATVGGSNLLLTDRLEILGLYRKMATQMQYTRTAYYCGTGLGIDQGTMDGEDIRDGVLVQSGSGPFAIRFVTDQNIPPDTTGTLGTSDRKLEVGFSIDYKLQTTCSIIEETV